MAGACSGLSRARCPKVEYTFGGGAESRRRSELRSSNSRFSGHLIGYKNMTSLVNNPNDANGTERCVTDNSTEFKGHQRVDDLLSIWGLAVISSRVRAADALEVFGSICFGPSDILSVSQL